MHYIPRAVDFSFVRLDWESTLQNITGLDVNFYRAFISFNDWFVAYLIFQTIFISLLSVNFVKNVLNSSQ